MKFVIALFHKRLILDVTCVREVELSRTATALFVFHFTGIRLTFIYLL